MRRALICHLTIILSSLLGVGSARFCFAAPAATPDKLDPAAVEFFETKIRPVLAERCYSCHSEQSKKLKGDLRLDSRAGSLRGGESGKPSVVPGDPDKSKLIEAVRYNNADLQMPPKEKLPGDQIAALEAWVKMGAPDPRTGGPVATAAPSHLDVAAAKLTWWSFMPVKMPAIPTVINKARVNTPIDSFILSALEAKGLTLSQPADKRTLIRRAYFDLIGLPPTAEEVQGFIADPSPNAFAAVVDRLLASPQYGERWGRYWLDVARYADTKGYVFQEERRYPFAYTYRDWVIRALNNDLPYDQFLLRQLAADQLPTGEDKQDLAAMGFLTVGRRFLNQQPDIIDDRIDVVCRGTMGLTVACARCHDHKYDPIATKDYYSLYGVFASSQEPKDLPALAAVPSPQTTEYEAAVAGIKTEIDKFESKRHTELTADLRTAKSIADYLAATKDVGQGRDARAGAKSLGLRPFALQRWRTFITAEAPERRAIFGIWRFYAALDDANIATAQVKIKPEWNPIVVKAFTEGEKPKSLREVAERYAGLLAKFDGTEIRADVNEEALRQVLRGPSAPPAVALVDVQQLFLRDDIDARRKIQNKIDALLATHPGSPPHAMVLNDLPQPVQPHVFVRGNPNNPGEVVPRQFPAIVSPDKREPFKQGSGRLEMAKLIASKDNPLTARVMVNRVWLHHFGFGLVRTPSDFGRRGDAPTHPLLLDYLARKFMDQGWSLKKLHREIMLSAVYQQISDDNALARQADPENRLLWRMNRQRLDFEAMRDEVLLVSGQLNPAQFGRPIELDAQANRRTIYGFIDRQNLPSMFRAFDFASPDAHSPQRFFTTVPQQALFMMNSPFVLNSARALAKRSEEAADGAGASQRVTRLYQLVYGRKPAPQELQVGLQFIAQGNSTGADEPVAVPTWQYGYGEFDETTKKMKGFEPLPHFTGSTYQGGTKVPDATLIFCSLTAMGGHPGTDAQHAAIRRWTAPADGVITISGTLNHPEAKGDGVRARIVSSRKALLGTWTALHSQAVTRLEGVAVVKGDTIDFVVDCIGNDQFDTFEWAPVIRMIKGGEAVAKPRWSAKDDFSKAAPGSTVRLSVWEKYAQVLLECNEFVFVD